MLNAKQTLQLAYDNCTYPCQASRILPKESLSYSTDTKPTRLGECFHADVMVEGGQKILVVRENLSSFTDTLLIRNQTKQCLRDSLLIMVTKLKLGPSASVRVDGHSSLASLRSNKSLEPAGLFLVLGRPKNTNKNAAVDKAIRELREQLVKVSPHGGPYSEAALAKATNHLNELIRFSGRSSKEIWLSRDQNTGSNISLDDHLLSDEQFSRRQASHGSSAKYHSRGAPSLPLPNLHLGTLVYVKNDRSKSKARDPFVVIALDPDKRLATLQKFPMSNFRFKPILVEYQHLYLAKDPPPSQASGSPAATPVDTPVDTPVGTPVGNPLWRFF